MYPDDFNQFRFARGCAYGLAVSIPIWIVIIITLYMLITHTGG